MKVRILLILIGLLPLPVGFLINRLMMTIWLYTISSGLLWFTGLFFILLWYIAGFVSVKWVDSRKDTLIYLNAVPGLVLILVLFQEFIIGRYWPNWAGISTQFYYLPLMHVSSNIMRFLPIRTIMLAYICIVAFSIQFLASFLGRKRGERSLRG